MKTRKKINFLKLFSFLIFIFAFYLFIYSYIPIIPIFSDSNKSTLVNDSIDGVIVRKNKSISEEENSFKINNE